MTFDRVAVRRLFLAIVVVPVLIATGSFFVDPSVNNGVHWLDNAAHSQELPCQDEAEEDRFAVPDGADAEQLFAFIRRVQLMRGRSVETMVMAARAAASAAETIRSLEAVSPEDELRAVREQLSALKYLKRHDPPSQRRIADLLDTLKRDARSEFRRIGDIEEFESRIAGASRADEQAQLRLVEELRTLITRHDFDRETHRLASSLALAISQSESVELAASLFEELADQMNQSPDPSLRDRAAKTRGTARRLRLPGHPLELSGTTVAGTDFDWNAYRDKVVLVDFWASWCAPCTAEFPNMERNLERYGARGFAIVGVNLDQTLEECRQHIEQYRLTWTNLRSEVDGQRGLHHPLAIYYGVTEIPLAILVDQRGVVVSLDARGGELDRLLDQLLGGDDSQACDEGTDATKGLADTWDLIR